MSAPDYRYLQAWARPSASSSSTTGPPRVYESNNSYEVLLPTTDGDTATQASNTANTGSSKKMKNDAADSAKAQQTTYQVRLDTPGGITYAPDMLAQHNSVKRLFIPGTALEKGSEYNFHREIQRREAKADVKDDVMGQEPELDELGRTAAQAYKDSVKTETADSADKEDSVKEFDIPGTGSTTAPGNITAAVEQDPEKDFSDRASIRTNATTSSVISKMTSLTLATERTQSIPTNVVANSVAVPFRAPASITGGDTSTKDWTSHRKLDRISEKEKQLGITQFEEATQGRVPSVYEASLYPSASSDAATMRTICSPDDLRIEDLFLPDPRPWRPLRWVRKVDPRQMLILCAGATLTPGQAAAIKYDQGDASSMRTMDTKGASKNQKSAWDSASTYSAVPTSFNVEATRKAMFAAGKLPDYKTLEAQLKSSSGPMPTGLGFGEEEEVRAGLGFVFCPSHDVRTDTALKRTVRPESNFSRRLEKPPDFSSSTIRRAALRSVLAALEFTRWEQEGFDKIVIGTHHGWLVDGITKGIWEWRHNQWRLNTESPLGMVGDQVPDRDLWELLDRAVKGYEEIDCTVRFWKIRKEQNMEAVKLAQEGASKDNQQPATVRWTKKKAVAT